MQPPREQERETWETYKGLPPGSARRRGEPAAIGPAKGLSRGTGTPSIMLDDAIRPPSRRRSKAIFSIASVLAEPPGSPVGASAFTRDVSCQRYRSSSAETGQRRICPRRSASRVAFWGGGPRRGEGSPSKMKARGALTRQSAGAGPGSTGEERGSTARAWRSFKERVPDASLQRPELRRADCRPAGTRNSLACRRPRSRQCV